MIDKVKYYCGVGARSTPKDVLDAMYAYSRLQAFEGWCLRSGHADGADTAFEDGCDSVKGKKEIWLPWKGFNGSNSTFILPESGSQFEQAMEIASSVHPAWHRCSPAARRLHARNVFQVLGGDFKTPAEKVVCWTENGKEKGGTRTAIVLAQLHNIPVINLGKLKETMLFSRETERAAYELLMRK